MRRSLFLCLALIFTACERPPEKSQVRPVRAVIIDESALYASRYFPGSTRAVDRVNLSFRVSGPLVERPVNVGDGVKKGQLLARIDPADFKVNVENAQGGLERAQAELRFAESDFERVRRLQQKDPGAISASVVDRKREDVGRIRGEVRSLEAQLQQAQNNLEYTRLLAPFDGTVTSVFVQNFEFVQAQQSIVRVLNTEQVEMVVDIPERMISLLPKVDDIYVRFDVLSEEKVPATVKEIGTEASATTRTYPVTLLIDQPESFAVYAGMSGWAEFIVRNIAALGIEGYFLPASSIFSDDDIEQSYVWVVNTGTMTVSRRPVTVQSVETRGVFVTEGLEQGEWVVTAGANRLEEGQKVLLQPVELGEHGEQIELPSGIWRKKS
ncbi:MAG: efflux RND transporter periplasmic adaptor subunit, partial [Chlamydiia bacterium]|nr:efflux RND transporter periplasmic adaptor subunit [Chlamydiia bacterium]